MNQLRQLGAVTVIERAALLVGSILIVVAIGAFDWRLGLGALGAALVVASTDWRRP